MICPIHKYQEEEKEDVCPICEKNNMLALKIEWDKQDRVISSLTKASDEWIFDPSRSKAILIFRKNSRVV
jgi:hypothetical protein